MFLCAISNNNRDQTDALDVASVFTTNLTEPLNVKDFTIELVDCIITADNLITITQRNNTFVFRVGGEKVSEQYQATIEPGRYRPLKIAELILEKLKELTPIQGWVSDDPNTNPTFSWSVDYDTTLSNKFNIKYTKLPTHSQHISDKIVNQNIDIGYESVITESGSGSICNYVNNFTNNVENNIPSIQQNKPYSYEGLNIGLEPDYNNLTTFDNLGIAENGGAMTIEIKPMLVCKTNSYCSTDLAIATSEVKRMNYFVIEDETFNTPYDSKVFSDSFLNPLSGTNLKEDKLGKHYCSGIIIDIPTGKTSDSSRAEKGLPYARNTTTMFFPPRNDVIFNTSGVLTDNIGRKEVISSTWNNNILVEGLGIKKNADGTNTYNALKNRAFHLTLDNSTGLGATNAEAKSTLKFYDATETEPISMRLAIKPLIAGLRQGLNTTTQTYITATGGGINQILTPGTGTITPTPGTTFSVKYKTGIVGKYNTEYGNPIGRNLTTNNGGANGRLPYYMITELDANDLPSKIITMDGGENILDGQNLYLNDPATFDTFQNGVLVDLPIPTQDSFVDTICSFITPTTDIIGASVSAYTTKYQYLPTQLSAINDLIYDATGIPGNQENQGFSNQNNFTYGPIFGKDCEFSLIPLDSEIADENESVRFEISAFIPNNLEYANEDDIINEYQQYNGTNRKGVEYVMLDCVPGSWNSDIVLTNPAGTTRTLTNWTTFVQNSATSRIKLTLEIDDYYKFKCNVAYSLNSGTTYVGDTTIIETFETATVNGIDLSKFECTSKSRLYPMHPSISAYPGSGFNDTNQGVNNIIIKESSLARYGQKLNSLGQNMSNYNFKIGNIPNGSTNTPNIFDFPNDADELEPTASLAPLEEPPIMIKFGPSITAGTPSFGTNGVLSANDIPPALLQHSSETLGFDDSYFVVASDYTTGVIDIGATSKPLFLPAINTFVVEMANFPAKGFITFGYNRNTNIQSGLGNSSQIVGVVPFLVDRDITLGQNDNFITLQYNAPYSQPVNISLPTEQFIYNFDFRLRDITTGNYVSGLLNPTQLIFRIQKM